jgi:8-oxo-dGTP pyrophosphatase MutT (NUDIX family)
MAQIIDERTERLTRVTRDMTHPNQRPKDAATLILLDRSGREPKVLLGRRHERLAFMPDFYVFPGGRLDPRDRLLPAEGALDPRDMARLMRGGRPITADRARALALTAIRETFEETGLFLGKAPLPAPRADRASFADLLRAGLRPELGALQFVARAITPPRRPRRYDTRFFTADVAHIGVRVEGMTGPDAELIDLKWVPVGETRHLKMPEITAVVLDELVTRIRTGLGRDAPVPFFRMLNRRFVLELL